VLILAGFVYFKRAVDEHADLASATFGPALDAGVDQLLCNLQALVEDDAVGDRNLYFVSAAEAHQRDVALHASKTYPVLACGGLA